LICAVRISHSKLGSSEIESLIKVALIVGILSGNQCKGSDNTSSLSNERFSWETYYLNGHTMSESNRRKLYSLLEDPDNNKCADCRAESKLRYNSRIEMFYYIQYAILTTFCSITLKRARMGFLQFRSIFVRNVWECSSKTRCPHQSYQVSQTGQLGSNSNL